MKDTYTLDEHDFALIRAFKWASKDNPCTLDKLAAIWNERVGYDYETEKCIPYIVEHLIDMANKLDLLKGYNLIEFLKNLSPDYNYYFTCISRPYLTKETTDYNLILLSARSPPPW